MCWGDSTSGELGNGTTTSSDVPSPVSGLSSDVTALSAGSFITCAIAGGAVECWGQGPLGNGAIVESDVPLPISSLISGATDISVGIDTCAVVNNAADCWGYNISGDLGNGTIDSNYSPVRVQGLNQGVTAIRSGGATAQDGSPLSYACAIVDGSVKCWGDNSVGELGNGTFTNSLVPTDVIGLTTGVVAIGVAGLSACALLNSGAEECWGDDHFGQLGDGRFLTAENPVVVVAGDEIFGDGFDVQ
jgi:alpha-tubulin suppressor-like RCC1 family protein